MSELIRATCLSVLAAGIVAQAACSKDNAAGSSAAVNSAPAASPAAAQADADLSDISKYRLSMDKVDKYIAAQSNLVAKMKSMSPAERQALDARNDASDSNGNLDDMVAKIEKEPMMVDAIRAAGLSPREWVVITMSMMQTGMAASVAKMRPNDNQDSLIREMKANPENIKWYNEHEAEITQKTKAIDAQMKALEGNG
jgi:hypothetical protein